MAVRIPIKCDECIYYLKHDVTKCLYEMKQEHEFKLKATNIFQYCRLMPLKQFKHILPSL